MTHDYKYEGLREEDRNALIPAIRGDSNTSQNNNERRKMKAKIEFDYNEFNSLKPYGRLLINDRLRAFYTADTFEEVERNLLEQARHLSALPEPPPPKEYDVQPRPTTDEMVSRFEVVSRFEGMEVQS